jgi:3-hydroxybutyryl-CoA dehydrogenase
MKINTIMVVGAGQMGSGIAQVAAYSGGFNVIMHDIADQFVNKGFNTISKNLNRLIIKEKLTVDDVAAILARIKRTTDWEDAKDVDFVIEAITETFEAKKEVFEKLDSLCRPEVIFASNTSSIPITKLATTVKRQDKFIGMHFFNPVPVMRLVEVARGLKTSLETIAITEQVASNMKKDSIHVKDVPGFLVNRLNYALRCEAYNCLMEGVASMEDIDKAAKLGLGHPMGPFELSDLVGLDIAFNGIKMFWESYGEIKWHPNMILERLVINNELGRKTGRGWYDYSSGEKKKRTDVEW